MHHNVLRTIDGANPIDLACVDPPLAHAIHANGSFRFDVCSFEKWQLSPQATCVHMRMRMRAMYVRCTCAHMRACTCAHMRACIASCMRTRVKKKSGMMKQKKPTPRMWTAWGTPGGRAHDVEGAAQSWRVVERPRSPSLVTGTRIKRVQESQEAEAAQPAHAVLRSTAGSPARRALSAQALPARLVSRHRTCANDNDK